MIRNRIAQRFSVTHYSITEESFWRNYFYRVSLICQAADLGTLGDSNEFVKRGASEDTEGNVYCLFHLVSSPRGFFPPSDVPTRDSFTILSVVFNV